MENFSIYKYMKLGIVHFKAFPLIANGEGPDRRDAPEDRGG